MRFNLSEWALNHRSFVVYCMVALTIVGAISYYRLGRNEDPAFTFRTMVVQAAWPGATLQETLDQVTERIERTLKETPHLDFLRSYTSAGVTTIFVTLKGSTPGGEVPDIWYHVRKSVGDIRHTLPAGVVVLMAKFCEPHMLYYPELRKALDASDVPHLLIETEHEGLPLESIRTRVETFLERIRRP